MIYAVIMAGGKGERFWPLSRSGRPKQLLKITSDKTMLEETIVRMEDFVPEEQIRIITGADIKDKIQTILPQLDTDHIYTEPFGRNTLLAIAVSAVMIEKDDPEGIMVVLSSDHMIKPRETLIRNLEAAANICQDQDWLITLGITPTRPETGYGYIKVGDLYDTVNGTSAYRVAEFTEKPTRIIAQQYYFDRQHLWNSGMFIWSVKSIMKAIEKIKPDLFEQLQIFKEHIGTENEETAKRELYNKAEDVSIDVGILEQANNVLTLKADMVWDDVGSWLALDRIKHRDSENNILEGNVINLGSYESVVYNDSEGLIATLGVSDLIIVKTDNIVMVAHKTQVNKIKKMLSRFSGDKDLEKYL
ncbi:MAG: NTP transferase domain-containing protein [candidate division Zixibacteria bacterium]|nr:NTP transferase domain-containing protein [candidate division Zixibacteria bacterium]